MNGYTNTIEKSTKHWNSLPSNIFVSLYKRGMKEIVLIKFRETTGKRSLFNEIEPWPGIKFIDVIGSRDYFLGEFIVINKSIWKICVAAQAIILVPKTRVISKPKVSKIRDDGFIKSYSTSNNSLVLAKV
jgi:hypothetical protein